MDVPIGQQAIVRIDGRASTNGAAAANTSPARAIEAIRRRITGKITRPHPPSPSPAGEGVAEGRG